LSDADEQRDRDDDDRQRDADQGRPPDRPGTRRRRKLTRRLEEREKQDGQLSDTTELMVVGGPEHTFRLLGERLTSSGGPVRDVLKLVGELAELVLAAFPAADPGLASVTSPASIDVTFYVPQHERAAARAWSDYHEDQESYEALPNTTLALATVADVLTYAPPDAARQARAISGQTSDRLRKLAVGLREREVSLGLPTTPPLATPNWSQEVVDHIDRYEEVKPTIVTVVGVLAGARAKRARPGDFELDTDPTIRLDPAVGQRLSPGATITGELSPNARQQIREGGLWDKHVEARIKVTRRRQGTSDTIANRRMTAVKPRPGYHST
jgi:hypothetical protein